MTNADISPKPAIGSVAPVQVVSLWKHPMVIIMSCIAAIPAVIAGLVQLKALPGLPTNVTAWIGTAISVLTVILTILRNLGLLGLPSVTPTAAAKLIQTTPDNTQ